MQVFATSRALRRYYEEASSSNTLIDKGITIAQFFSKVTLVEDATFATFEQRLILLAQAAHFTDFSKLRIDKNLLSFLHNSEYIFSFFQELAGEKVSIEYIDTFDTYAEYEEHLSVLNTLYENYITLLKHNNLVDTIYFQSVYRINSAFLETIMSIDIHLQGYLTAVELDIIKAASQHTKIVLHIDAHTFNQKVLSRLEEAFGVVLKPNMHYRIDISSCAIVYEKELSYDLSHVKAFALPERIAQVGFVKHAVYEMVTHEHIKPENIVVIVPSEEFAQILELYNSENNFNFAMGAPIAHTLFYQRFEAILAYFMQDNAQTRYRYMRLIQGYEGAVEVLRLHYAQSVSKELFAKIITPFIVTLNEELKEDVEAMLFEFLKMYHLFEQQTLKNILYVFLQKIRTISIDDTHGGKVTVMGVLESRFMAYEGVIVVDFNDQYVPKRSSKDMFLSSSIKALSNLPTASHREALQKYFYVQLFAQAKTVRLGYVKNDTHIASKFLWQLDIPIDEHAPDFTSILYENHPLLVREVPDITLKYDLSKEPLSASKLSMFLTCKRKFYYRYIKKLNDHELDEDMPNERDIGMWLHDALQKVYEKSSYFDDAQKLSGALNDALTPYKKRTVMGRYMVNLWLEKLKPFIDNEIARFESGMQVFATERKLTQAFEGFTLVGTIDRIDKDKAGNLHILDYKSGAIRIDDTIQKVEKSSDFQLAIYALLAQNMGEVASCALYALGEGIAFHEVLLNEKVARLKALLKELKTQTHIEFGLTDDTQACRYCAYTTLCNRS